MPVGTHTRTADPRGDSSGLWLQGVPDDRPGYKKYEPRIVALVFRCTAISKPARSTAEHRSPGCQPTNSLA